MSTARRAPAPTLDARVWRDLTLLAAQSFAIGIAVSLLLGLAVFAVAWR
ncbi:MAG TPA: hypothetical protein VF814_16365 [Casimicrobiaceae bacterium]